MSRHKHNPAEALATVRFQSVELSLVSAAREGGLDVSSVISHLGRL